jgi:hypothetical protein
VILNRKVFIRLLVVASGAGIILLSLFASPLGLDNDPGWGPRRFQILGAGIAIILFGTLYWITPVFSHWFETSLKPSLEGSFFFPRQQSIPNGTVRPGKQSFYRRLSQGHWFGWFLRNQSNIWLVLAGACLVWAYVWIITIGSMEKWPEGRNYYWMLTQAFQNGQTYLLVDPNPDLLALENPYDLQQRKGLEYLWDTTLYNAKYYLYWGPVPAVLGVLVNSITSKPVADSGLVFSFIFGTALFSVLLLKKICQDYRFPGWVFWGGALSTAINIPLVWLLTHPAYYEVSIAGGQFFMMAGFLLLYLAFRSSPPSNGYLLLSALAFGLAGGTRVNLLPSVIFLALVVLWRVYISHGRKLSASIPSWLVTIVPLAIIACSLAWYNYVRFGSIFEFGHRYQLTGLSQTEHYGDQISVSYMVPNLYTYIFRMPYLSGKFPFVTIPAIKENMWPFFLRLPANYYYPEPTAGALLVIPLLGFTAILVIRLLWLVANGEVSLTGNRAIPSNSLFVWFGFSLLGYVLIQMVLLFVFVSSSMRYLFDLSPALILLSTMFVGYHVQSFEKKPYVVNILSVLWILSSLLTVISGFFIGITGGQNNFLNKNPQLYYQLLEWFSR